MHGFLFSFEQSQTKTVMQLVSCGGFFFPVSCGQCGGLSAFVSYPHPRRVRWPNPGNFTMQDIGIATLGSPPHHNIGSRQVQAVRCVSLHKLIGPDSLNTTIQFSGPHTRTATELQHNHYSHGSWGMVSLATAEDAQKAKGFPYTAIASRELARFMENYGTAHVAAAKHLLRYLQGTASHSITQLGGYDMVHPPFKVLTDLEWEWATHESQSPASLS
ncbi:hypothetical protein B0H19DRAFT_1069675 [Mycena capillaripes]|nr:hypothetical protein B0H19DRAFT_1069675 [Mycena capillaripes]